MDEATIAINGTILTTGQVMALRVAVSDFISQMADPDALGEDQHGRAMVLAYRDRLSEVLKLMHGTR